MYRILAVAVGPANAAFPNPITASNPTNVRPYIHGLIDGLLLGYGLSIGKDYDIWYRTCPIGTAGAFDDGADGKSNDLIFPMSTRVMADAINSGIAKPIVSPTASNFQQDVAANPPGNVAGINAQRDQGKKLVDYFRQAWPSLQTLYYLHLTGYGPSERAKQGVDTEAAHLGIHHHPLNVTETNLNAQLNSLPNQDGQTGLLVLPIDFCLGEGTKQAPNIIQVAQGKQIPTFFPIPDWADQTAATPAFGGYGLSQITCGKLASDLIYTILWQGASPDTYGIVPAPPSLFELVVNQTAADKLSIRLPRNLQRQVRP
jgi:ABC-type uncharacterized transport system substrate-binding protein